ncbi:MAG: putative rane protein [Sphingomonadales bacterium]|nr:putative rane protein [Sphingomonadales bacterium]
MSAPAPEAKRLHPASLIVRWLKIVPQMLAGGIGLAATASHEGIRRFILFAMFAALVGALFALLSWWRFLYTIGPGEIAIEKGVIRRQRRVIPFDRVQDVAIERGLIARLFGTARVRIETGGAAKDEGELDMVALGDAHALRDRVRHGARSEAAEIATPVAEPVLFALDVPRLLLSGLFGFSLVFLAAIAAVVQQLDQFNLVDWDQWFTAERAEAASHLVTLQIVLILGVLIVLAGTVAGVVRTVLRDFGFRLTRTEAGLRRRRGLFTLSEVVIPLRRTQAALIESGLIGRALGWHRLSFQTLGADRKEGGVQIAAPFARMDEILAILAEAGFPAPPPREDFRGGPRRALLRWAAPWLALALAAAAGAWLFDLRAAFAAIAFVLLGLAAMLHWRVHRHSADADALYVSHGLLKRRLAILPYEKTQIIAVSRGPLQRGLALATIAVDTAGAQPMRGIRMAHLDSSEADAGADRLHAALLAARAALKAGGKSG